MRPSFVDSLSPFRTRQQIVLGLYILTAVVWLSQFPTNFGSLEPIDTAYTGVALFFTGGTLLVITKLDLFTVEAGWAVLTYSYYVRFLDELAEGPETLESALPGTIRLLALALILLGFIRATDRLNSSLTERDERLTVINRVLRHDLRNSLNIVIGELNEARKRADSDMEARYESALDTATDLLARTEKIREIDTLLEQSDEDTPVDLNEVVARTVERFRSEYAGVTFTAQLASQSAVTTTKGVETAVENVVENACEHNDADDPEVTVVVETSGSAVRVRVHDNGSGIPPQELEPIREGDESALSHTSGIGLWLVHWVVERASGDLSFDRRDGQTVTLRFPRSGTRTLRSRISGRTGR